MFDTALVPTGAAEFGFTLFDSIEAALCCGGDTLAVDAVLMVAPERLFASIQDRFGCPMSY
eukprot:COSAG04_NODE_3_length_53939_cov_50.145431_35_plen_61_part_00